MRRNVIGTNINGETNGWLITDVIWAEVSFFVNSHGVNFAHCWDVAGAALDCVVIVAHMLWTISVIRVPVHSGRISDTRPVGTSFDGVIVVTGVLWAVHSISIKSFRINITRMIITSNLSIVVVAVMKWAVDMSRCHRIEPFIVWIVEAHAFLTCWVNKTRAAWGSVARGHTFIFGWWVNWVSSTSTFRKMIVLRFFTEAWSWCITVWVVIVHRKTTVCCWWETFHFIIGISHPKSTIRRISVSTIWIN